MALLGSSVDPSLFSNDYSGFARAGAIQGQMYADIGKQIGSTVESVGKDYATEQKKAKEIAANIKGSLTLLDNAKGIYKDLAPQIDSIKTKLIDPSISDEEKLVLSRQVEPLVNMYANYGMEGAKIRLMEAQAAEASAGRAPKTELTTVVNPQTGQEIPVIVDFSTGEATPVTAENMPAAQPPARTQGTPQGDIGEPPLMAQTIEGPDIPLNESQLIQKLENGDEVRVYNGKQYVVPAPSVLPPKDQTGAAISAAQNMNVPSTVGAPDAGAIAQTSQMFGPASSRISSGFLAQAGYPSGGEPQAMAQPVQAAPAPTVQPQAAPAQPQAAPSRMVMPAPKKYAPESPAAQASRKLRDDLTTAEIAIAKNKLAEAQGTQEQKEKTAAEARMANDRAKREALTIVKSATNLTNEILKNIPEDNAASTLWRSLAPEAIAREQKKLSNALKPIEAQVMLRTLNSLREASTTGGSGLGPLSDREGQLLMSSIASLDPYADPTDIRRSLKAINDHFINAEFGDREERIQLVRENKMTVPKFNEIEEKYSISKPLKLPDIPLTNRTPAQEEALNKHLQSK